MSKSTSPSRPKPLGCKAEETAERQPRVEYTEESHPMQLSEAAEYFGLSIAKVFRVIEGAYIPEGRKGVTEGKGFIKLWTAIGAHCRYYHIVDRPPLLQENDSLSEITMNVVLNVHSPFAADGPGRLLQLTSPITNYCMFCINYYSVGDIFIVCLKNSAPFLMLRPAVPSPGRDSVAVPVITPTEFALIPPNQEGNETDAAIRNWEGVFQSVTEFLRKGHSIPMPAVSVYSYTCMHAAKFRHPNAY